MLWNLLRPKGAFPQVKAWVGGETFWKKILLFPANKDVFATTKVVDTFFKKDKASAELVETIKKHDLLYRDLKECRNFPIWKSAKIFPAVGNMGLGEIMNLSQRNTEITLSQTF